MTTIWLNAGELSGDLHGQALLQALRAREPDVRTLGMGGNFMQAEGMQTLLRIEDLSVLGITEALAAVPRAFGMLRRIRTELRRLSQAGEVDAVVLIDAPDFNVRVAKIAWRLGIPVYYYIPPKIWAWRIGRVRFLRRLARKIFCILPFEPDFYRSHGLGPDKAVFIGNPLVDLVDWPSLRGLEPVPNRIGIMPGSRRKEILNLLPVFGHTAARLRASHPELEFHCFRAPNVDESLLRDHWPVDVPLTIIDPERRYAAMRSCLCLLAASGTATLEAALAGVPTVLAYRVSWLSGAIARRVIKVPFTGLPNLILGREVFPECLQDRANPQAMAAIIQGWIEHPERLRTIRDDLERIRELCGPPGSASRAAALLLEDLRAVDGSGADPEPVGGEVCRKNT